MKQFKVFALVLCIATIGLATSCSKEEKKENASIVGKWKCIYTLVNDFDYRQAGSKIEIDTNYCNYIDDNRIGKIWEFKQDGSFHREGEQWITYNVFGNKLSFRRPDDTVDMPGRWKINELHEEYVKLDYVYDRRSASGVGNYLKEEYVLSRIIENNTDPNPDPASNLNSNINTITATTRSRMDVDHAQNDLLPFQPRPLSITI